MSEYFPVSVSEILAEAREMISRNTGMLAAWILGAGICFGAADYLLDMWRDGNSQNSNPITSIGQTVVQYFLISRLLFAEGMIGTPAPGRFGSFFGASILGALGIILGALLFLLPGLLLACRWYLGPVIAIAEGTGASDALSRSAAATGGNRWSLFWVMVIYWLVFGIFMVGEGVAFAMMGGGDQHSATALFALALTMNLSVVLCEAMGAAFHVAAYKLIGRPGSDLREIFA